jgi:hypothetical protein
MSMSKDYLLYSLKKLGDGLYGLEHIRWRRQLWTICKVRKDHKCVMTGKSIKKGEDAYRPITNRGNRYERISKAFFKANR